MSEMELAVVIPSRNSENLRACLDALYRHHPSAAVFVVDDGLERKPSDCLILHGEKPFVFARNANIGLRRVFEAGFQCAILLNDDALLENPGFGLLARRAIESGGLAAPPFPGQETLLRRMIPFWSVAIPRSTWVRVGELDQRFVNYGWEDNDYCRRVLAAGLPLGVCAECHVRHQLDRHTFSRDCRPNARIYAEKWNVKLLPEELAFMKQLGVELVTA